METGKGFNDERPLDGGCTGDLNAWTLLAAWGSTLRRESEIAVDPEPRDSAGGHERRYDRFEAITVRAAARVLQLQQSGIVSAWEAGFYLHELVDMDRYASPGAYSSLLRMAQRHLGHRAPVRARTSEDPDESRPLWLDHPVCLGLELALMG